MNYKTLSGKRQASGIVLYSIFAHTFPPVDKRVISIYNTFVVTLSLIQAAFLETVVLLSLWVTEGTNGLLR